MTDLERLIDIVDALASENERCHPLSSRARDIAILAGELASEQMLKRSAREQKWLSEQAHKGG